jgi:hypothetical protein
MSNARYPRLGPWLKGEAVPDRLRDVARSRGIPANARLASSSLLNFGATHFRLLFAYWRIMRQWGNGAR